MKRLSAVFFFVLFVVGCVKTVTIVPVDKEGATVEAARIQVDGTPAGQGTTSIPVKHAVNVSVDASPKYYSTNFPVNKTTSSPVTVALVLDDIYAMTVEDQNKIINIWLTLNISDSAKENNKWWTVVVNAISSQDFELELMDKSSGFIRSAWKERRFGTHAIRRRFIGNVVSTDPLQWRVKYQVQTTNSAAKDAEWTDYPRGLKDELDVIEEIRGRTQGETK